ncbi:helix-turn-helix domain-containing protein [Streptosporangium sp. NBC_01756]|uniref:helix-turn-helix domain-containing protein n=1 Tax=Streptosporangium sp. NBC_01756 TaxID=2975950 RepID=UPI002DDAF584|nr:helix-turn-helix domain-containing protein [Streptosporangium sp. NBC_01756]WSC86201.1 TetR/AcrR family transcriptional regulator [Streptosporangium sp. NBC_01756]
MPDVRRTNRGPSVAAANRAALIAAAREVFATTGYDAPLSTVARAAGVGQGSLYRHFPDRVSLALAVFENGVADLEALAAEPGATLDDVLALITEQTIASTAFIDMVSGIPADARVIAIRERVAGLLAGLLSEARSAGRVRQDLTTEDLVLAVGMLAGVLAKRSALARRVAAAQVWALLRKGMDA